jgi:hypothetical protein
MLFINGYLEHDDGSAFVYEDSRHRVYYRGLIYLQGRKCGVEAIRHVLGNVNNSQIHEVDRIRGNFWMVIQDKRSGFRYVLSDNSGICRLYTHNSMVSTSFLELIRFIKAKKGDLNREAVGAFLFEGCYAESTLIQSVEIMPKTKYFVYDEADKLLTPEKGIRELKEKNEINIIDFFREFYASVKESKICMDLTGGNDTRLCVSIMKGIGADFELAISGVIGVKDVETAIEIAKILNKKLSVTYHENDLTDEVLKKLFVITDGTVNLLQYHRNHQFNMEKKNRGIDIQITGHGGALYNDMFWLQDFPFYNRRRSNIDRLLRWRLGAARFPMHILTDEYKELVLLAKEMKRQRMERLVLATNSQTYDNIVYNYLAPRNMSAYGTINSKYSMCYHPLLELDLVRVVFNLPRRERFYNNFQRKYITLGAPEICQMLNTNNVTTSSRALDKLADIPRYIDNMNKRLVRKILQKTVGKTYLTVSADNPEVIGTARRLPLVREQITKLKDLNVLSRGVEPETLSREDLGRFVTFGLFLDELR